MTAQNRETTASIVNQLFDRLIAINPAFKQAWPTEHEFQATKKEWVLAFEDARINTIEQLKSGLKSVRMNPSPFIPSPGQFIQMCKQSPEDIGAPSVEKAYDEACRKSHPSYGQNKNWSHPAVENARNSVGAYDLSNLPAKQTLKRFTEVYRDACDQFGSGSNLNQIEQRKERHFTDVEMHWILHYKEALKEHGNHEDALSYRFFPGREVAIKAGQLYHEFTKLGGV